MQPFEWKRLLLGEDAPWSYIFEVLFRTGVMYVIMVLFFKLAGRKEMKQLTIYDLIIIVGLGSAAGDPMFYDDVPLLHALAVFSGVFFIYIFINKLTQRNPKAYEWLDGKTDCILDGNKINCKALYKEGMNESDLYSDLRIANVSHLGQVKKIFLEHSGEFSIFYHREEDVTYGLPLWPGELENFTKGIPLPGFYSCAKCGNTHEYTHAVEIANCNHCGRKEWVRSWNEKRIT